MSDRDKVYKMTKDMMTSTDDLLKIGSSAVENGNYDNALAAFNSVILNDLLNY
jgi:TolA-binding protein